MSTKITILIIQIICCFSIKAQINIDTLRYEKKGEYKAWITNNYIAHNRPIWRMKFNIEKGQNLIYREDGSLYFQGSYIQKEDSSFVKNGKFEYYYENGQVRDSGVYENNKRIGLWAHFDKNGVLIYKQDFHSLIRTYFYSNKDTLAYGKMKFQEEIINNDFFDLNEHEGYWVFRNFDGSCDCQGILVSNLKHGKWIYYSYDKNKFTKTKKSYFKYVANYNYKFLDLCKWK